MVRHLATQHRSCEIDVLATRYLLWARSIHSKIVTTALTSTLGYKFAIVGFAKSHLPLTILADIAAPANFHSRSLLLLRGFAFWIPHSV